MLSLWSIIDQIVISKFEGKYIIGEIMFNKLKKVYLLRKLVTPIKLYFIVYTILYYKVSLK